jgi:ribosome-associated toxin RatA of RatAB toxin-antitoxin module
MSARNLEMPPSSGRLVFAALLLATACSPAMPEPPAANTPTPRKAPPSTTSSELLAPVPTKEWPRTVERYSRPTVDPPNGIDTGGAEVLVEAPIAIVRRIATDYRSYKDYMPAVDQSRIIKRNGQVTDVYLHVPIFKRTASIWAVIQFAPVPSKGGETYEGRLIDGNVDDLRILYRLIPISPTSTAVQTELLVEPKLPMPTAFLTEELAKAAFKVVSRVRERAEAQYREQAPVEPLPEDVPPVEPTDAVDPANPAPNPGPPTKAP